MKRIAISALIIIILILRFWGIERVPPHLRNDEAALGYNAYSILKSGGDEHGQFLPIFLKSFGDWKPALYTYLTIPFVSFLGLNELSVRLPAAISGIIAVYLFYLLVFRLFKDKRIAFFSAFLLATSPWHIAFSRGAWEAQIAVTLTIAALICFLKGLKENKFFLLSALLFGSTFLTSHSAKPSTPLVLIVIFLAYRKKMLKIPLKIFLLSSVIFIIVVTPVILSFFNGKSSRVESLLVFTQFNSFLQNWVNHYSLSMLFISGDGNPQHTAADFGPFLLLDLLFLILGIKIFISEGYYKLSAGKLILYWIILSPLSSVLAEGDINIVRYMNFFVLLTLVMGFGLSQLRGGKLAVIFTLYLLSFTVFLDSYLIHTPPKNGAWQSGYKEIVQFIIPIQAKYEKIYVPQSSDQPYIFFLFYQSYPPKKIQRDIALSFLPNQYHGMGAVSKLDNIEFVDLEKVDLFKDKNTLIVLPENNPSYKGIFKDLPIIKIIKDPIGLPIFKILEHSP